MQDLSLKCHICGQVLSHCPGHEKPRGHIFAVLDERRIGEWERTHRKPQGVRTKSEPLKIKPRREDAPSPLYNNRSPRKVAREDTPELRSEVKAKVVAFIDAREAYLEAMRAVEGMDDLPDSILKDLPMHARRCIRVYRTRK
jgi:hypothetical protein